MQTQQTPQVLPQPFAAQGDKNTIPNAATGTNKASLQEGFPPITGQPINKGGIPPERQDFNGAMNLNSQFYFAFQNGWWPTFTQEVSDAIGGYPQGAVLWLFDTENKVYTPLLSLVGNNTYNFNTNPEYIGQYWARILPDSGRGLPLGAIYFSSSSNADDNPGALPLWSGAYYTNASTLYPAFYNWVKSHTELCKTKTQYDSAISTYGECPYYVVDEVAGSLRLPKLVNYLKMANATDGVTQSGAGLPNITGSLTNNKQDFNNATGAFQLTGAATQNLYSANGTSRTGNYGVASLDASLSSSVYGSSDTVTPAHTTAFPWVVSTASDAESSATAAAQSADAAAASAINASNSAEAAESSATAAQSSATAAESSATNAQTYANTATSKAAEAADSAAAANSASGAATSKANAAAASAAEAETAKTDAQSAQTAAEAAKTAAQSAKTAAESAKTQAAASATSASQSAQEAAQSASAINPNAYLKKEGDSMAGRLTMGANDIYFANPNGTSLHMATDGSNWDFRGNKTWLRFAPIFGLTIRDAEGTGDFYNLLHSQNFAPDYANKINFSANGTDNTAVKTGYVMIQLNASAAGTSRICTLCIKRNGSEVFSADIGNTTNLEGRYFMSFPIAKGDVYAVSCYNETAATCYFIPLLGA